VSKKNAQGETETFHNIVYS
jgi:hypothetical protein